MSSCQIHYEACPDRSDHITKGYVKTICCLTVFVLSALPFCEQFAITWRSSIKLCTAVFRTTCSADRKRQFRDDLALYGNFFEFSSPAETCILREAHMFCDFCGYQMRNICEEQKHLHWHLWLMQTIFEPQHCRSKCVLLGGQVKFIRQRGSVSLATNGYKFLERLSIDRNEKDGLIVSVSLASMRNGNS